MSPSERKPSSFYRWNRQLHLYLGIAISPVLLVFAVSTLFLNHGVKPSPSESKETVPLVLREGVEGQELVADVLDQLQLRGEVIGNGQIRNGRTTIRVARPGDAKFINVDFEKSEALITERSFGFLDRLRYLHLNPGPHKSPSWFFSKLWGWVADSTVYLTLLLTLTGLYMWAVLKSERRSGLVALGSGVFAFTAILYALVAL